MLVSFKFKRSLSKVPMHGDQGKPIFSSAVHNDMNFLLSVTEKFQGKEY